jgi:hypothetical protein
VWRDVRADGRLVPLRSKGVRASHGWDHDSVQDVVSIAAASRSRGEERVAHLGDAEAGGIGAELVSKARPDVNDSHPGRSLGVADMDLRVCQSDVLLVERA